MSDKTDVVLGVFVLAALIVTAGLWPAQLVALAVGLSALKYLAEG